MFLRILRGRHKRRNRGRLKLGRRRIRSLSEEEFRGLIKSVRAGYGIAAKRHAVKIKRTLQLLRRPPDEINVARRLIIRRGFRESEVLDSIFPGRQAAWLPSWDRTISGEVNLDQFSFLDYPIETIERLRAIAECEATCKVFSINFDDEHCRDISPYMVLGLIREKMLPVCYGGRIKKRIARVIHAVHLDDFLGIEIAAATNAPTIWPFPLRQRRGVAASRRDDTAWAVTSEERVDSKLVDTINDWLGKLTPPFGLSGIGRSNILTLIGEILDNAKRHSDLSEDGTWAIAGFMEARLRSPATDGIAYVCNLAIISPGHSIFETLSRGPADVREKIAKFAEEHLPTWPSSKAYDEQALWTLCSLQDGVSRVPSTDQSINGFGMMTLVEMVNELGRSSRLDEQPRMTIISGGSCLMIKPPYNMPAKLPEGHRVLALNASNDLRYPPDENYVFALPYTFPGTIVTVRFCLDAAELIQRNK